MDGQQHVLYDIFNSVARMLTRDPQTTIDAAFLRDKIEPLLRELQSNA